MERKPSRTVSQPRPRSGDGAGPVVHSVLLQDLLRSKKAESQRAQAVSKGAGRAVSGGDIGRLVQSSPAVPQRSVSLNQGRRPSGLGLSGSVASVANAGMGLRETETYTSKLLKENFDLKLEVFHRRERTAALEKQLEATKKMDEVNAELQEVNDLLVKELEKRDKAVEEAVGIICKLEEKVERLMRRTSQSSLPSSEVFSSGDDEEHAPASSPPQVALLAPETPTGAPMTDAITPRSAAGRASSRTPSFLGSGKSSAGALRSLYLAGEEKKRGLLNTTPLSRPANTVESYHPTPGSPDSTPDTINSPRLSLLSESSFFSVYGKAKQPDFGRDDLLEPVLETGGETSAETSDDAQSPLSPASDQMSPDQVERWVASRATPSKPRERGQYLSVGAALKRPGRLVDVSPQKTRTDESATIGGPIFAQGLLPPTPDTMTTVDPDASSRSSSTEKSLLDGTPQPMRSHKTLDPQAKHFRPLTADCAPGRTSRQLDFDGAIAAPASDESASNQAERGGGVGSWGQSPAARRAAANGGRKAAVGKSQQVVNMMFDGQGIDDFRATNMRTTTAHSDRRPKTGGERAEWRY
ncbi:MAG: hypothetical protein M1832_003307 [Thelocarpon impressellum]|nr:MAG: hypothetical protein M1832_003307 [Thelocarpon impressellum]